VPVRVVNDSSCDTSHPRLRVINQIPNSILYVVPLHDLAAVRAATHHILIDDPLHKVHVFWPVHDTIEFLPIRDHGRVVPLPREHLGLTIEAPAVEPVPIERVIAPHFEPVLRCPSSEVGSEAGPLWERETLLVDGFLLLAGGGSLDDRVGGEVTRTGALSTDAGLITTKLAFGNSELNCSSGQILKGPLELSRDGISHRFGKPAEMNGGDCPVSRGHIADDKITVVLVVKEHLPGVVVLPRDQRERAVVTAREHQERLTGNIRDRDASHICRSRESQQDSYKHKQDPFHFHFPSRARLIISPSTRVSFNHWRISGSAGLSIGKLGLSPKKSRMNSTMYLIVRPTF
jgi:hypothetical protein